MCKGFGWETSLEQEILAIADHERERLSRELHDGLCQSLAGIAALASAHAKRLAANTEPNASATAEEIARLLHEAIREARDLAHSLGPIGLSGTPLGGALAVLARNVSRSYHISCRSTLDPSCPKLPREMEAHLIRMTQEAVRNALTHGRADEIDISLECVDGSGLLSIMDNGVGLVEHYRDHGGMGVHTMEYRARAIGGSLTMALVPERGTLVACTFPLPATHERGNGSTHALLCPA